MDGFFMHSRNLLQRTASDKRLTAADRQILDVAMLHTRNPGLPVGLGIDFLIAESQLARRTVIRARRHLTELGYLILGDIGKRGLSRFIVATGASDDTCTGATDDTHENPRGATEDTGTGATGDTGTSVIDGTHIDTGYIETTTYAPNNDKPPSCSVPTTAESDASKQPTEQPTDSGKLDSIPLAQGTATPSPTPSPATGGKVKVPAPKVTWDGTRLIVPDILMASWSESHPHVDLQAAIRKASSWCLANPGKRPKKDFARFLNGWFGRVKPGDPEYLDADERAASDAALIREVEFAIDDADERADYWYRCQRRGEYVPHGVDCRPMPDTIEEVRQAERKGAV